MSATAYGVDAGGYARRGAGLVVSDYLYLAAVAVAVLVAVDPLEAGLGSHPLFRHLALALAVPALALAGLGARLRRYGAPEEAAARPFALLWPLLALGAVVAGGSLHARLVQGLNSTFLNVGLYMFMSYVAAQMVLKSPAPEALVRAYLNVLLAGALVMAAFLAYYFRSRQVYHEQIFLVIPMAVLFFARPRGTALRWAGCAFFLAMAWLSAKYTSYIIGALTVAWLALFVAVPRLAPRPGLQRVMMTYWTFLLGLVLAAAFGYLAVRGMLELPTGNVDYRSHTYGLAFDKFLDRPLAGTLFAAEAVEKFSLYAVEGSHDNRLATHSDVLDLLANGGLLACLLWLLGHYRVARFVFPRLLSASQLGRSWAPAAHTLAVLTLAGIVTYCFNPILLQPGMAFLLWTNLGLLAGLALRVGAGGMPQPAREQPSSDHRRGYRGGGAPGFRTELPHGRPAAQRRS